MAENQNNTDPVVDTTPTLTLRGEYSYGRNEFSIADPRSGTGGEFHFKVDNYKGTEIVKLTVTDGHKEYSIEPPFTNENITNVYSEDRGDHYYNDFKISAYGLNNGTLTGILEVEDSFGNISIVKETIEKNTGYDAVTNILGSYIEDDIL